MRVTEAEAYTQHARHGFGWEGEGGCGWCSNRTLSCHATTERGPVVELRAQAGVPRAAPIMQLIGCQLLSATTLTLTLPCRRRSCWTRRKPAACWIVERENGGRGGGGTSNEWSEERKKAMSDADPAERNERRCGSSDELHVGHVLAGIRLCAARR